MTYACLASWIPKPKGGLCFIGQWSTHVRTFSYLMRAERPSAITFGKTYRKLICLNGSQVEPSSFQQRVPFHCITNLTGQRGRHYSGKAGCSTRFGVLKHFKYSTTSVVFCNPREQNNTSEMSKERQPQEDVPKENIVTVPNLLTLSRALLSPVLGYLVVVGSYPWALGIFIYAGITDYLDGWIARRWPSQQSVCGTVVDPIADKLLVVIFAASLNYVGLIPGYLAFLIIIKDVALVIGGFVVRWISLEKPITFKKFFDFKLPSMEMKPLLISKVNTALQIGTLAVSLAAPVFSFVGHPILPVLWYSTAISTVLTGLSYAATKGSYEIKQPKKKE